MINSKSKLICYLIRITGISLFLRAIYAKRKVTIVNYHSPAKEIFESHMRMFSKIYNLISMDQLYDAIARKDFSGLPIKSLVVTIDDGHKSNVELLDVIKRYKVTVIVYAVSGLINTNRHFWFNIDGLTHDKILKLKTLDDQERRQVLTTQFNHTDEREYAEPHALSAKDLKELINAGVVVGSHTVFHPELSKCSDVVGIMECCESKKMLESITGNEIKHFAYPSGAYDQRCKEWLKKAGYRTARTIKAGWVRPDTGLYELPNFGINDNAGVSKAIVQACGLWDTIKGLLRKVR